MTDSDQPLHSPTTDYRTSQPQSIPPTSAPNGDPIVPLANLSAVNARMDTLQRFLTNAIDRNTVIGKEHMAMVSAELISGITQTIVNGAALLSYTTSNQIPNLRPVATTPPEVMAAGGTENRKRSRTIEDLVDIKPNRKSYPDLKTEVIGDEMNIYVEKKEEDDQDGDFDVVEIDAVELLAEQIHLCEICGKGFKRDANLRMHMRAHGDQYKKPEALSKPVAAKDSTGNNDTISDSTIVGNKRTTRFSCPYAGCNRNQKHMRFRPLKSVSCVKNHFKRSHCPKMFRCNRCNKKNFSVMADLKSHLKHCGEARWKCSCGTTFSRKDKLFGHMALFEGHMPAVGHGTVAADVEIESKSKATVIVEDEQEEEEEEEVRTTGAGSSSNNGVLLDGMNRMLFEGYDDMFVQDWLDCSNSPPYGFGIGSMF